MVALIILSQRSVRMTKFNNRIVCRWRDVSRTRSLCVYLKHRHPKRRHIPKRTQEVFQMG